ncbi:MAG TPA: zf-HC2 domain-containing protein [Candidatus Binatia bacterium]|nr:zf-HC2 domain-containing protein [Candidatus Binatia bacterium]
MRCSSCEPLLSAYLESALRGRQSLEVAEHLRGCTSCTAFLDELRVIDALLTTAHAPGGVSSDFTESVLSATRETAPALPRRVPLVLPLVLYLAAAWTITATIVFQSRGMARIAAASLALEERNLVALGAVLRSFAPATPFAAAVVTVVLMLDILVLCAIFYGYRRIRPIIATYFTKGSRS